MKRIIIVLSLIFCFGNLISQQNENFIVGLPKVSSVQLDFVKDKLMDMPKVISAEYIYKDNILLIESDSQATQGLEYAEIEKILLEYFNAADIYKKEGFNFAQVKSENIKSDKYLLK